uniref:Putative secreted protein n=1 Tax=Anopheles marajoara TaxID=58244 RepID=A0A2M4CFE9_9DIPT
MLFGLSGFIFMLSFSSHLVSVHPVVHLENVLLLALSLSLPFFLRLFSPRRFVLFSSHRGPHGRRPCF